MPFGEGANWDGTVTANEMTDVGVTAASSPVTGVVRLGLEVGDTPTIIAKKLADAWNVRRPIGDIFAIADGPVTAFFMTGTMAEIKRDANGRPDLDPGGNVQYLHTIQDMTATFENKPRDILSDVGISASSTKNPGVTMTRVDTNLQLASALQGAFDSCVIEKTADAQRVVMTGLSPGWELQPGSRSGDYQLIASL